jgi:hypothetical protein
MKRWLLAVVFAMSTSGAVVSAADAPIISATQFQKLQKFLDTIGGKENFPAPMSEALGFSNDLTAVLPVLQITTDDHTVYFSRSQLNPEDYIIWARTKGDNQSSYMFSTHSDFKLIRALYLHTNDFPKLQDINSPKIQTLYRNALVALAKDVDKSPLP